MRIKGAKAVHYDSGPNMTPLVDVVMVILIFLMMAGSFGGAEHYLTTNIPLKQKGVGAVQPPPGFIPDEPINIRVDSREGGFEALVEGKAKVANAESLRALLGTMRDQFDKANTSVDKIQI